MVIIINNQEKNTNLNFIKAIVISKISGEYLLDLILDSDINPILLSSFIGALSLFGGENLGKITDIKIKGLDLEMIVVNKYELIFIVIMDKNYVREYIRDEAEKALDMFYILYKEEIKDVIHISVFESFKKILLLQIQEYLEKIENSKKKEEIGDFGFFTDSIKNLRNNSD